MSAAALAHYGGAASVELLTVLSVLYLYCGIEDLLLDLVAWVKGLRPSELGEDALDGMELRRQKRIAIIVPAWRESAILPRMLAGNLSAIQYQNFEVFVGIYPNDPDSIREMRAVSERFPNVHAVVNPRPGPTSKGQILNEVVRAIRLRHLQGEEYDALLMQDAEDIIHPMALHLVNERLDHADFVQIPVFSLGVRLRQFVAGTYVDEFAESHTKDLLVRAHLGGAVPSAGVGTAISRKVVDHFIGRRGALFNEDLLTEDYALGVETHLAGFRGEFAARFYRRADGKREYIATREYFPKAWRRSIRQKTRWVTGIAFQSARHLGWGGSVANNYFLFRDRRAPIANVSALGGWLGASYLLAYWATGHHQYLLVAPWVIYTDLALAGNRLLQRAICVGSVYGPRAALGIPLRWPIAIGINASASVHAARNYFKSRFGEVPLPWVKTEHELPANFGQPVRVPEGVV